MLPDNLKGYEVKCGWCKKTFLYDNVGDHKHFKNYKYFDYDPDTKEIVPFDENDMPIFEDPALKAAVYSQNKPDPPDHSLKGITSISQGIAICVRGHKGIYDPKCGWDTKAKTLAFDVIAIRLNEEMSLQNEEKLTGALVKTKWDNIRKSFVARRNSYQYAKDLTYLTKYLKSTKENNASEKASLKRKGDVELPDVSGLESSKRMKINLE